MAALPNAPGLDNDERFNWLPAARQRYKGNTAWIRRASITSRPGRDSRSASGDYFSKLGGWPKSASEDQAVNTAPSVEKSP